MDDCERTDLEIVINVPTYWGVSDDGMPNYFDERGEGEPADMCNFDSYKCRNCDEFFTQDEDNDDAWQKALEHLKVKEVA